MEHNSPILQVENLHKHFLLKKDWEEGIVFS